MPDLETNLKNTSPKPHYNKIETRPKPQKLVFETFITGRQLQQICVNLKTAFFNFSSKKVNLRLEIIWKSIGKILFNSTFHHRKLLSMKHCLSLFFYAKLFLLKKNYFIKDGKHGLGNLCIDGNEPL